MARLNVHRGILETPRIPSAAEYRVLTPPGWIREERLPLLLVLHGANSFSEILEIQKVWTSDFVLPAIVACLSVATTRGYYIDHEAGREWETAVSEDFPRQIEEAFGIDPGKIALFGSSMGGYGALKIAFRNPGRFKAVAALEPTLFPGMEPDQIVARNKMGELAGLLAAMRPRFNQEHVAIIAKSRAAELKSLPIYMDCGDSDSFFLQDGVEYLHRVLWDLDVGHEYRLLRGADHVGPEIPIRQAAALRFIAQAFAEPKNEPSSVVDDYVKWNLNRRVGPAPAVDFETEEGREVFRLMVQPLIAEALRDDPTVLKRFGALPPS